MSRPTFQLSVIVRCRHQHFRKLCVPVQHPVPEDFRCAAGGGSVGPIVGTSSGCGCAVDTSAVQAFAEESARSGRWGHWKRLGHDAVVYDTP